LRQTKTQKDWNNYWIQQEEEVEKTKPKSEIKKRLAAGVILVVCVGAVYCNYGRIEDAVMSFRESHEGKLDSYIDRYEWDEVYQDPAVMNEDLEVLLNVFDLSREYNSKEEYYDLCKHVEELTIDDSYETTRQAAIDYLKTWEQIFDTETSDEAKKLTDKLNQLSTKYYDELEKRFRQMM